jgi:diaminobutyrate-2-oxoglutarate transaminase
MSTYQLEETTIFAARESAVRGYCRSWPTVFDRAVGSWLYDESGRRYLDFFAGAGALNYGHNTPVLKDALIAYLSADRVVHSLDMYTAAKREFLSVFDELILSPRDLDYRVQFPGPGGTNAVEAALKLARKVSGRTEVIYFANAFHGMTLGALAVTANPYYRGGAGVPLAHTTPLPFDNSAHTQAPDLAWFDVSAAGSGIDLADVAAVIVETVQGEGGVNVARLEWLRCLADWCQLRGLLLIVDDVQMGCGRTGPFFSFEAAGIKPDLVCLSKAISGYGMPLALTLMRPELDIWQPGEHNGTFRGFDPAFVTGAAALRTFWQGNAFERSTIAKGERLADALMAIARAASGSEIEPRGRGMVRGLAFSEPELAGQVRDAAFERGLLVETTGPDGGVVKLLPPLTATDDELDQGVALLADAVRAVC